MLMHSNRSLVRESYGRDQLSGRPDWTYSVLGIAAYTALYRRVRVLASSQFWVLASTQLWVSMR